MKTGRMVIDFPADMPPGILHKAMAEAARQYGCRLRYEPMDAPKGSYFLIEANYYTAEKPKGAA